MMVTKAKQAWYNLSNVREIDTPALVIYPERVKENILEMITIAGSPKRLFPHVKTHKMSSIIKMHLELGIGSFKCATIAEAEMLAKCEVEKILLAYQLNYTKAIRFLHLVQSFKNIVFSCIVDNFESAVLLNNIFRDADLKVSVYLDIDNGMHRTGFDIRGDIAAFYKKISQLSNIRIVGLHVYDGHIINENTETRESMCDKAYSSINEGLIELEQLHKSKLEVIVGGTPTFPIHALRPDVFCSPGTTVLWDEGYDLLLPEMNFLFAAILLSRIISKPIKNIITIDLGYKSVSCENSIEKRVRFLNLEKYKIISQDEEHLMIEIGVPEWNNLNIGDILYGLPYHVCPTVALYDEVQIAENGLVSGQWKVDARSKKYNF